MTTSLCCQKLNINSSRFLLFGSWYSSSQILMTVDYKIEILTVECASEFLFFVFRFIGTKLYLMLFLFYAGVHIKFYDFWLRWSSKKYISLTGLIVLHDDESRI